MNEGFLMLGALLALVGVAIWYVRIAEDPSVIDEEESRAVRKETSEEVERGSRARLYAEPRDEDELDGEFK